MTLPFFEEEPESFTPVQQMLEEVVGAFCSIAPITSYQITPVIIPSGEGYAIDIYIENRNPIYAYLEVKPDMHITFNLLAAYLLRLVQREDSTRGLFNASDN